MNRLHIRQGHVCWVDDFPPLDGGHEKRRPVVVFTPSPLIRDGKPLIVVACTTTPGRDDLSKILLPNTLDNPTSTSGLTERTWAIPRWNLPVEPERLEEAVGYISGNVLQSILRAVVEWRRLNPPPASPAQ